MHVLLVDDEKEFASSLAERLRLRGVETEIAGDAQAALELFRSKGPWDAVFLDLGLPDSDGTALLKAMQQTDPDQPAIMISGSDDVGSAVEAMRQGAINWLPKPIDLKSVLGECLRAKKLREQRLEDAWLAESARLKLLGRVAEGVAHEVNNPLNIAVQAAGLIEDSLLGLPEQVLPDKAELLAAADSIRRQGRRVRAITGKLLMIGHGTGAKSGPIDVAAVVGRVIDLLAERAKMAGARIETRFREADGQPSGPESELQQICLHLIENAIDATPEGKTVSVRGGPCKDESGKDVYRIAVLDQGKGIPKEDLERIFDPFFTTKASRPGKYTGLGLAVARSLAHGFGARLFASNSSEGGALFELLLPMGI